MLPSKYYEYLMSLLLLGKFLHDSRQINPYFEGYESSKLLLPNLI